MDDIVRQAMTKWPNVPNCFGWLALDRRGQWRMRNEYAQANKLSGEPIRHAALIDFIVRNYAHDDAGRWFFQNGPQRVYVELEAAPWVWRLQAAGPGKPPQISGHTGREAVFGSAWLDDAGRLFLECDIGFGLVHTLDAGLAADAIEAGDWRLSEMPFALMPSRFGYVLSPATGRA